MAEKFGKTHKYVLEKIEALEVPEDFMSANFSAYMVEHPMPRGGFAQDPAYEMTRDPGCMSAGCRRGIDLLTPFATL